MTAATTAAATATIEAGETEETDRIIRFLGLEPDPACLRFHETKRVVLTPSQDQVREPMHRLGIGRWKRSEKHIGPLLEAFPVPHA